MATIILAGGLSKRMGRDKASIPFGESTLLHSLVSRFAGEFGGVIIVARPGQEQFDENALTVHDHYKNAGPLAGLHAGLLASPDEQNFVLACDMPFAGPELARHLVSLLPGYDAVVPVLDPTPPPPRRGLGGGPEPLFAAYHKSALPEITSSLDGGRLKMRDLLDRLHVLYVPENEIREHDPELRGFQNLNTPEDLEGMGKWEV